MWENLLQCLLQIRPSCLCAGRLCVFPFKWAAADCVTDCGYTRPNEPRGAGSPGNWWCDDPNWGGLCVNRAVWGNLGPIFGVAACMQRSQLDWLC